MTLTTRLVIRSALTDCADPRTPSGDPRNLRGGGNPVRVLECCESG